MQNDVVVQSATEAYDLAIDERKAKKMMLEFVLCQNSKTTVLYDDMLCYINRG